MQKIVYLEKQDVVHPEAQPLDEEARIDVAVKWINTKVAHTLHFGLVQIGYYLLNTFFDGKIEDALSRSPKKAQSFRRLCRRPDLVISSSHLINSVKLVVQEQKLRGDTVFVNLPVSHKIALLPVESVEMKKMLALRTVDEGLSVRALTKEVRSAKKTGLPQQAWSRRLRRALETVKKEMSAPEASSLKELGSQEAEKLKHTVQDTKSELEQVLAKLPEKQTATAPRKRTRKKRGLPVEPSDVVTEIQVAERQSVIESDAVQTEPSNPETAIEPTAVQPAPPLHEQAVVVAEPEQAGEETAAEARAS